jgi:antitoxin component YwqK of YwqJK toxin-antitoxin module
MKILINRYTLLLLTITLCSYCSRTDKKIINSNTKHESLIEVKNNIYHEYYPGKKQLKFKGGQDKNSLRHGIWEFYDPTGLTLSSTHYEHGKKDGISYVNYPNGKLFYIGEYANDTEIGEWKTYDQSGKLKTTKQYTID